MSNTRLGLAVGLALGFAAAFGGPIAFAVVLGCGAAGLFLGQMLDGGNDLPAVADSLIGRVRRARAQVTITSKEWWSRARTDAARRAHAWQPRLRARSEAWSRIWLRIRTRTADALDDRRPRAGALEETAVLDLRHLTDETLEIRPRRGLARLGPGGRLRAGRR